MGSLFLAGCALIGGGLVWRTHGPRIMKAAQAAVPSQRYKGGFVDQMDRVEAGRILGISPNSSIKKIKERHIRLMFQNHPDRGGSPYVATKINEASDLLQKK